ncbi:uncharacterized protein LOC131047670 [Cryptomeria japonica]|uniref:uncharacterized protein LOC131047670 n=1 Tax=Cryptomeria japonica TaxID=3369 RepID=UPI0025AC3549|nr:uncharacterized protein LOC131047670 [Cryptomeria japonica]
MGNCKSSQVYNPTAKIIMEDGELKEFVEPVRVEETMRGRNGFFICHSDSIDINQYLSPLPPQYQLKLGHLYFELPVNKLEYPLPASDMVALATKACAALKLAHSKSSCCCKIMVFSSRNKLQFGGEHEELNSENGSATIRTNMGIKRIDMIDCKTCKSRLPTIPEGLAS